MPLFDMIKEALTPQIDESAMEMMERDSSAEDRAAMEALGGLGEIPETPVVEDRLIGAMEALQTIERHMEFHPEEVEPSHIEALHRALEANLPTEPPAYDPTSELEEIEQTLAGIDMTDENDPDQPQPDENIENDMTISDLMNVLQDTQKDDPETNGVLNV